MPTIDDLIAQQAVNSPTRIAVIGTHYSITYSELVVRATATAARLRTAGVEPGQVVGLSARRSPDAVAALLGVLIANCAYVYLDPTYPEQRNAFMARECTLSHALVDDPIHHRLLNVAAVPLIGGREAEGQPDQFRRRANDDHDLCYVCFTSGSTGHPKGVLIEHGGVLNMVRGLREIFGITARSKVLQFASWNFDAAACEIFVTLGAGATLCLAPERTQTAGPELAAYLREQKITFATLTPSVLDTLCPHEVPDSTAIAAVGEPCPDDLVTQWADKHRFFNGYGPTETTVAATVAELGASDKTHIGRPIPGAEIRVVSLDDGQPARAGELGELQVAGRGVARGYLNQSELTAERFIPDHYEPSKRWYRTGDIAKQHPDGRIAFIGRTDNQVKIRGHRIELEEVDAALRRHPLVKQCVTVRLGGGRESRLVAHIVPADDTLTPASLRESAMTWLPTRMMPDQILLLQHLPLTPLGKVDRSALAQPNRQDPRDTANNDLVTHVLAILRRATASATLGSNDDIFDYDVHSLATAQISAEINSKLGVRIPMLTIFDNPTASQIASIIASKQAINKEGETSTSIRSA